MRARIGILLSTGETMWKVTSFAIVLLCFLSAHMVMGPEKSIGAIPYTHVEDFQESFLTGLELGWNKTYGGIESDYALAVVQTSDGGYALAGSTYSYGAGSSDMWLVKTAADGSHEWNKTYGGAGGDHALDLIQTVDGGYALAGSTYSYGVRRDAWLVKADASGNHLWNKTYGGTGEDRAYALVQTADEGYALVGASDSWGTGAHDFWIVKTDSGGTHLWNKTYGGTGEDFAYVLVETTDKGYALTGTTYSFGAGNGDAWLIRTSAEGQVQWNQTYGGAGEEYASSMVQTSDGGYALAGMTGSFGAGNDDYWLVKTDETGVIPELLSAEFLTAAMLLAASVTMLIKKIQHVDHSNSHEQRES
jgi:hypothetical protein